MRCSILHSRTRPARPRQRLVVRVETLEPRALLSAVTFHVDPMRSSLSLSGNAAGYNLQEQGTGSLTTTYSGTINADVETGMLTLTGGSQVIAANSGNWRPGNTPANYGGTADAGFLGTADAAVRNLVLSATSSPFAVASDGTFNPSAVTFTAITGNLDYTSMLFGSHGTQDFSGRSTQDQASGGEYTTAGGTATLLLPVNITYTFTLLTPDDSQATVTGNLVATAQVQTPPRLNSITLGDGTAQRSEVRSATLVFDHRVMLGTGAVTLASTSGGTSADASAALGMPTTSDGGITWMIPFVPGTIYTDASGSLIDGSYSFTVHAADVTDSAGNTLNGGDQTLGFHRLFGDINGDGAVNNTDFFKFKSTFGRSTGDPSFITAFDYNADGVINNTDFFQFKKRFGVRV